MSCWSKKQIGSQMQVSQVFFGESNALSVNFVLSKMCVVERDVKFSCHELDVKPWTLSSEMSSAHYPV